MRLQFNSHVLAAITVASVSVAACTPYMGLPAQDEQAFEILFAGDTSHAESYHVQYEAKGRGHIVKEQGYYYSFEKLKPLLDAADYTIVNIETPLTELRDPPFPNKGYNHWTEPDEAGAAYRDHGFDAVSLANNHTVDFGVPGLVDTFEALDKVGIAYFGAGMTKAEADAPFKTSFAIGRCTVGMSVFGRFEYRDSYEKKYAFYALEDRPGASALHIEELVADIKALKERSPNEYIVVYPHWGKNYRWRNEIQEEHAKAMFDAGADLVLGHGAHTLGEVVGEDDGLIVYSLGNFVFNTRGGFHRYPEILPMSMISSLSLRDTAEGLDARLKLYPIYSNNRVIDYQPRFVTAEEFDLVVKTLEEKGTGGAVLSKRQDRFGHYIEVPLKAPACKA